MSDIKAPEAKKYAFKNGGAQIVHPFYGVNNPITLEHLNGPQGEVFIKALKKLDPKGWFEANIVVK